MVLKIPRAALNWARGFVTLIQPNELKVVQIDCPQSDDFGARAAAATQAEWATGFNESVFVNG